MMNWNSPIQFGVMALMLAATLIAGRRLFRHPTRFGIYLREGGRVIFLGLLLVGGIIGAALISQQIKSELARCGIIAFGGLVPFAVGLWFITPGLELIRHDLLSFMGKTKTTVSEA